MCYRDLPCETDKWKGYDPLDHLGRVPQYVHQSVNHSRFFKDPLTRVCKNEVEAYWSRLKQEAPVSQKESDLNEAFARKEEQKEMG